MLEATGAHGAAMTARRPCSTAARRPFLGLAPRARAASALLVGRAVLPAGNFELMLRQTAVVGMAALGMTLVIIAGGIDLSVGSIVALSTVVVALPPARRTCPRRVAALGGVAAGALCGAAHGVLVTRPAA